MKIGIIGNGHVGIGPTLLNCNDIETFVYDIVPEKCSPKDITFDIFRTSKFIFVCVPTPYSPATKSCHLGIVLDIVNKLKQIIDPNESHIIIRSTVVPGTSNSLNAHFMPEYLPEKKLDQFGSIPYYNFGLLNNEQDVKFKKDIKELFNLAHKNRVITNNILYFEDNNELEMEKYVTNSFLAVKVSFFNEMEEFCRNRNIDYNKMINIMDRDNRFIPHWNKIPGPDGKRGYGGYCLPKDINGLNGEFMKLGLDSYIIKSAIERNEMIDRPEKDWEVPNRTII